MLHSWITIAIPTKTAGGASVAATNSPVAAPETRLLRSDLGQGQRASGPGNQGDERGHRGNLRHRDHLACGHILAQQGAHRHAHHDSRANRHKVAEQTAPHQVQIPMRAGKGQVHGWTGKRCDQHGSNQQHNGIGEKANPGYRRAQHRIAQKAGPRTDTLQPAQEDLQRAALAHIGDLFGCIAVRRVEGKHISRRKGDPHILQIRFQCGYKRLHLMI